MRMTWFSLLAVLIELAGCSRPPAGESPANQPVEQLPAENAPAPAPATPAEPGTPGGLPDDRTPLEEPRGPIDPKSTEAAGQVAQSYGALIEQKRFAEAEKLWRDSARGRGVSNELRGYSEVHLQVGKPERPEGAAGSIYISVPTVLYGKRADGSAFSRSGQLTLRRVNDVPGSTAEQRRWHIDSAAWLEAR